MRGEIGFLYTNSGAITIEGENDDNMIENSDTSIRRIVRLY